MQSDGIREAEDRDLEEEERGKEEEVQKGIERGQAP